MTEAEKLYHDIASRLPDGKQGKMFGALCVKTPNGKAALMFWKGYMIFKLQGEDEKEALSLNGAKLFDPMDGRPMSGWVQLSFDHAAKWESLAKKAMDYVRTIKK